MADQSYQFNAPAFEITKSYRDDNGQMFLEGIASTVDIDLTGERMAPEALAKMAARAVGLPLRSEHGKGWDDRLGEIVRADVVQDDGGNPALWIKAKLFDWSSKARDLFGLLKSGTKLGLSVAGRIKPGGIVKELVDGVGKYIPTYKDVDLSEVSVTDHPANLGTFAVAVAKSLELGQAENPDIQQASNPDVPQSDNPEIQQAENPDGQIAKQYTDVPTGDFLDPEHRKYPIDEKHLLPALRYFNHTGQREAGGYTAEEWAAMGGKLATRVSQTTGATYRYDPSTESVTSESSSTREGVTHTKKTTNTNLIGDAVSPEVAALVKQFNPATDIVAKSSSSSDSSDSSDTSTGDATSSAVADLADAMNGDSASSDSSDSSSKSSDSDSSADSDTSSSSDSDSGASSTLESLLSDMKSSLESIASSVSSANSDASSDADSTSTDKAAPSSTPASSDSDDMTTAVTSLGKAVSQLSELIAKRKTSSVPPPAPKAPVTTPDATTSKALEAIMTKLDGMEKTQADLQSRLDAQPAPRKGIAVALKKSFAHDEDGQDIAKSTALYDQIVNDPAVSFAEQLTYKDFGILPKKYDKAAAA